MLYQVGPHTLCVATMDQHPQLPTASFSGCVKGVHMWHWHNQTYRLTNYSDEQAYTRIQWEVLHDANLGVSLEHFRSALNRSMDLQKLIADHNHNITRLHVSTLIAQKQVLAVAKLVEQKSASHWYDIFNGVSPFARGLLMPPLIAVCLIVLLVTIINVLTCLYVRSLRRDIDKKIYNVIMH
ncbi:hypothetical protein NQD34_001497 [Periophthalmus magnuspinnatus]|nr:hypothetical protein NQD34_001497 [Periophthalmus magnuspinnatus]